MDPVQGYEADDPDMHRQWDKLHGGRALNKVIMDLYRPTLIWSTRKRSLDVLVVRGTKIFLHYKTWHYLSYVVAEPSVRTDELRVCHVRSRESHTVTPRWQVSIGYSQVAREPR